MLKPNGALLKFECAKFVRSWNDRKDDVPGNIVRFMALIDEAWKIQEGLESSIRAGRSQVKGLRAAARFFRTVFIDALKYPLVVESYSAGSRSLFKVAAVVTCNTRRIRLYLASN
jgi:hypothetical protein